MKTVVHKMPPFRHEFYAIAIKADGDGKAVTGHHTDFPEGATIFFNSPFQLISWDIAPNWTGFYIIFSQDFVAKSSYFSDIFKEFPFLKFDRSIPFKIDDDDLQNILNIYENIHKEYFGDAEDKFKIIESYVILLLNFVKRYFTQQVDEEKAQQELRTADLKLLTRYQTLIQTSFYPETILETFSNLHSTRYYAQKLNVHPNHLNAVVKGITGKTALHQIHHHILQLAKSRLAQTEKSIKEIAYDLYFESPNNFSAFFKKNTGLTPGNYRKQVIL
jgi:AraC-like DNA-binding protein